ncbi:decaprenyl-phosphate phosphoribosyltransferase [bacterium]|nr:decaprenyl-phosphate phosphoribosyltransferase [bacterium]MBU1676365.1 decaprenyl-phosphate phosphoribosyltransferase [bacterium]
MKTSSIRTIFESLRPRQWTKNLILFAGLIFSQHATDPTLLWRATVGGILFCLLSGVVYIFNDIKDIEHDRRHPVKRERPLASGRLDVRAAEIAALVLAVVSLGGALLLGLRFALIAAMFLLLNVAYTHGLKRLVILDVVGIAIGFVLRAIASVEVLRDAAYHIPLSNWLILCTFLLALFLGFAKRRAEYMHVLPAGLETRPSLRFYNELTLNLLIGGTFALTVTAYAMYTMSPGTVAQFDTWHLVMTVPFVVWGLGRYLVLIFMDGQGSMPHEVLLTDIWIQLALLGWIVTACLVIGLQG